MRYLRDLILLFFLAITAACVTKIDLESSNSADRLVVDGAISNMEGPHSIYLSRTTNSFSSEQYVSPEPLRNAQVTVVDETSGERIPCVEIEDLGLYQTDTTYQATVGHSYYLEIINDGKTYRSKPQLVREPVEIDSVYLNYNVELEKMEIFVDTEDRAGENNYYRWTWNGFRQAITITAPVGDGIVCIPDTVLCCSQCYLPLKGTDVVVENDRLTNGNFYERLSVGLVELERPVQHLIQVQQHSISPETYDFWNLINLQRESEGGLFDPPPFQIASNVSNIDNPNEEVLGHFQVSGVSEGYYKFSARDFVSDRSAWDRLCDDCRWIPNADTLTPKNWNIN